MLLTGLPNEILLEIAEHLSRTNSLRSLANLCQASQQCRHVLEPTLYRTVIWFKTNPITKKEDDVVVLLGEGDPTPDAWKYIRYLFASSKIIGELEGLASRRGEGGLPALFPNLIVVVERLRHIGRADYCMPQHPRIYCRRSAARIYQPIKPCKFMADIVIGTERHLSELEETHKNLAENIGASVPISDEDRRRWVQTKYNVDTCVDPSLGLDSIQQIRFEGAGKFLPETSGDIDHFKYGPLQRFRLSVTFGRHHDNETNASGSETAQILSDVKGIMSLIQPYSEQTLGEHLPWLIFKGKDLPVQDIMKEIFSTGPWGARLEISTETTTFQRHLPAIRDHVKQLSRRWPGMRHAPYSDQRFTYYVELFRLQETCQSDTPSESTTFANVSIRTSGARRNQPEIQHEERLELSFKVLRGPEWEAVEIVKEYYKAGSEERINL